MTSETKHTPTPWVLDEYKSVVDERGRAVLVNGFSMVMSYGEDQNVAKANAAHIVKCVNMHDELVLTLKGLLDAYSKPDKQLCCNGRECGCYGATVQQQAEYYATEALKKQVRYE